MNLRATRLIYLILWMVVSSSGAFSQQAESQKLPAEALKLLQERRFDEAIQLANRVVALERGARPVNTRALGIALVNLSRMKEVQVRFAPRPAAVRGPYQPSASPSTRRTRAPGHIACACATCCVVNA